jgi:hypothetical protein
MSDAFDSRLIATLQRLETRKFDLTYRTTIESDALNKAKKFGFRLVADGEWVRFLVLEEEISDGITSEVERWQHAIPVKEGIARICQLISSAKMVATMFGNQWDAIEPMLMQGLDYLDRVLPDGD